MKSRPLMMLLLAFFFIAGLYPPVPAYAGDAARVSVSPASHDFGITSVGGVSAGQTFRLTNEGGGALAVSAITVSDDTNYMLDLEGGAEPCGRLESLAPGEACTVTVKFAPLAERVVDATLSAGPGGKASLTGLGYVCGC